MHNHRLAPRYCEPILKRRYLPLLSPQFSSVILIGPGAQRRWGGEIGMNIVTVVLTRTVFHVLAQAAHA
jgi:hypothetical protein